jgi:opacity protein-like surface antigen
MRGQRNALLAGVAALVLITGAGAASAQQPTQGGAAATGSGVTPQANKTPSAGHKAIGAQSQNQNARMNEEKSEHGGAQMHRGNKAAESNFANGKTERMKHHRKGEMARGEQGRMHGQNRGFETRQSAAQHNGMQGRPTVERNAQNAGARHNGYEGLQGNASGMNVRLNEQQRTQIRNTVIDVPGAPRLATANFDVTVGTVVPRVGVRLVPVPTTLVRIDPAWRGFRYFVWMDDLVIVNPRDMRIVAVVPV